MINVHLFGLGKISYSYGLTQRGKIKNHFKAINNHSKFHLKSIHEKSKNKINKFLNNHKINDLNINNFSSFGKNDLAIIGVNTSKQYKILNKIINYCNVKTILCEKPFTDNLNDQKKIIKLCRKKKIKLFVNFIRASDPNYLKIYNFIKNSKKNKFHIKVYFKDGIINNSSHYINFLLKCFGKPKGYKILKINKIKKIKGDYNFNFEINFRKAKAKFISQNSSVNLEMSIKSEKNEILVYKRKPVIFNDIKLKKTIDVYQYNVIDNIYKYYKKKKYNLCSGIEAHKTLKVCGEIIKRSK
jgi:hypothetical protein